MSQGDSPPSKLSRLGGLIATLPDLPGTALLVVPCQTEQSRREEPAFQRQDKVVVRARTLGSGPSSLSQIHTYKLVNAPNLQQWQTSSVNEVSIVCMWHTFGRLNLMVMYIKLLVECRQHKHSGNVNIIIFPVCGTNRGLGSNVKKMNVSDFKMS